MWRHVTVAIKFAFVTTVLLGIVYPLVVTGLAQAIFPEKANGSLIEKDRKIIGSQLIGQAFSRPEYFHTRPSAAFDPNPLKAPNTSTDSYVSSGSNLAPTSKTLGDRVRSDVERIRKENPGLKSGVPVDMVTTSASGLDPDITLANAYTQVNRIAKVRNMPEGKVRQIVDDNITERQLGVLGEPRVNVLALNQALDKASGAAGNE